MALGLALWGCDQGSRDDSPSYGPPLHVLATYPAAGEGQECDTSSPPDCGVPRDVTFQIRLDRFVRFDTAIRQGVKFYSGTEDNSAFLQPNIDVVERVLSFAVTDAAGNKAILPPGASYTIELPIPSAPDDYGLRAFDGAPLAEGPVPLTFEFRTQMIDPPAPAASAPDPTCDDVITQFSTIAGCATCHSKGYKPSCGFHQGLASGTCVPIPRMGLDLSTREGLLSTAINHVAHGADTGAKAGVALEDPARFGTGMPLIESGHPENSYLLYKAIRKPENYAGVKCGSSHPGLPAVTDCAPSSAESARLREWFVRGEPMPLTGHRTLDLELVQRWILAGARCP